MEIKIIIIFKNWHNLFKQGFSVKIECHKLLNISKIWDIIARVAQLIAIASAVSAVIAAISIGPLMHTEDSLSPPANDNLDSNSIDRGLKYLSDKQNDAGFWTYNGDRARIGVPNVGITSFASLAFLNDNNEKYSRVIENALDWIAYQSNEDGSISTSSYMGWKVYDTSLAVLAFIASGKQEYNGRIKKGTEFLIKAQNDEDEGFNESDRCYGGWGYPSPATQKWSDLSNTQFSLMAIHAARLAGMGTSLPLINADSSIWMKAKIFLNRCQMEDGGFIYRPENKGISQGGMTSAGISYGSMTAAGVWSLLLCGDDYTDGSLQSSLNWLDSEHYYIDQNYPYSDKWLYYYIMTFIKSYIMAEDIGWKSNHPYYYKDIANFLINKQEDDGHWENIEGDESSDILCTIEAITALQTKRGEIKPQYRHLSWLAFNLHSNADLHVYDPHGRHIGIDYVTGKTSDEIQGAEYEINGSGQFIRITNLESGEYTYKLFGTSNGGFKLDISSGIGQDIKDQKLISKNINNGEYYQGSVDVYGTLNLPINAEIETPIKKENILWNAIWLIRFNEIFIFMAIILTLVMILRMVAYFRFHTSNLIRDEANREKGYKYLAIDLMYLLLILYCVGIALFKSSSVVQSEILLLAGVLGSIIYIIKDNYKKISYVLWVTLLALVLSLVNIYISNHY